MGFLGRMTFVGQPITANALASGATASDLTMSGVLTVPAGALATPSIRFTGSNAGTGLSAETADQVMFGRAGSEIWRCLSGAFQVPAQLNIQAAAVHNGAMRLDAEAIKTADYTAGVADAIVIMNDGGGAALTLTLPPTPGGDQLLWVKNRGTSNLTVARNGNTIDGAAADLTLAAGAQALLYFEPSGWIRLGS